MNSPIPSDMFGRMPARNIQTPAARSTDPLSSHLAADEITASGKRQHQIDLVIGMVNAHPGKTSMELARLTGQDRYMIARRLSDAETAGAVKKGEIRDCTVSPRKAVPWWPAEAVIES